MSATAKANAELELRPLEAHELDLVSGGMTPEVSASVQGLGLYGPVDGGHGFGMNSLAAAVNFAVIAPPINWTMWSYFKGPAHVQLPAGV